LNNQTVGNTLPQ